VARIYLENSGVLIPDIFICISSAFGTNRTSRAGFAMSVDGGRPELSGAASIDANDPKRKSAKKKHSQKAKLEYVV
jgi:hypothetical protein